MVQTICIVRSITRDSQHLAITSTFCLHNVPTCNRVAIFHLSLKSRSRQLARPLFQHFYRGISTGRCAFPVSSISGYNGGSVLSSRFHLVVDQNKLRFSIAELTRYRVACIPVDLTRFKTTPLVSYTYLRGETHGLLSVGHGDLCRRTDVRESIKARRTVYNGCVFHVAGG